MVSILLGLSEMMEFFKILAWVLLNVAVPLLAPIALLPLLGVSEEYRNDVRKLVRRSLQDGQLLWTVIAMCAAACYEAVGHVATVEYFQISKAIASLIIAWHVVIIVVSSVLVLVGALDAARNERHRAAQQVSKVVGKPPRIMVLSIWLSAITAFTYLVTHIWAN